MVDGGRMIPREDWIAYAGGQFVVFIDEFFGWRCARKASGYGER